MITKGLLGGTAMLLAVAMPAAAQVSTGTGSDSAAGQFQGGARTPDAMSTGRQMGGEPGNDLAKPADPRFPATGPSIGKQAQPEGEDRAATNADTASPAPPTRQGEAAAAAEEPGVPPGDAGEHGVNPAERNVAPPQTVLGTRGGGALARDQIYAEDLNEYTVVNGEGAELGDVAGLVVNVQSGEVETLIVSQGGLAGVGDKLYDVPWDRVSSVDQREQQVRVDMPDVGMAPDAGQQSGGAQ